MSEIFGNIFKISTHSRYSRCSKPTRARLTTSFLDSKPRRAATPTTPPNTLCYHISTSARKHNIEAPPALKFVAKSKSRTGSGRQILTCFIVEHCIRPALCRRWTHFAGNNLESECRRLAQKLARLRKPRCFRPSVKMTRLKIRQSDWRRDGRLAERQTGRVPVSRGKSSHYPPDPGA